MQVEGGSLIGRATGTSSPGQLKEGTGLCSINRFAIYIHPRTNGLEALHTWSRDLPFCSGPHIQQKVATFAGYIHKHPDQCLR